MLNAVHVALPKEHTKNNAIRGICQRDLCFDINAQRVLLAAMENIGTRIKTVRKHQKLTQQELAELCGWEYQSRIAGYEKMGKKGGREPGSEEIAIIAQALRISAAWLATGEGRKDQAYNIPDSTTLMVGERSTAYNAEPLGYQEHRMPLISWVRAGQWCDSPDQFSTGDAEEWLPRPNGAGPRSFALRVEGDSMTSPYPAQRSYPAGTLIYIDPDRTVTNGCRVVARTPDGQYTFKVYSQDAGRHYLKPINPQYPMIEITTDMHICGVVFGSFVAE